MTGKEVREEGDTRALVGAIRFKAEKKIRQLINQLSDSMKFGALGEIRTPDLRIRSPLLYPAELQAHGKKVYNLLFTIYQPFFCLNCSFYPAGLIITTQTHHFPLVF